MTTPESSYKLTEELDEAAKRLKCPAYAMCFGCPGCALSDRLSIRAAVVREEEARLKAQANVADAVAFVAVAIVNAQLDAVRRIAGPDIPTPR
jgi:hypothetical protein